MRRLMGTIGGTCALLIATTGAALGNNPPSDPLPVNGEPNCFGARVSHSASEHGLTPKVKVMVTKALLADIPPGVFAPWQEYYAEHGVSVRTVQNWIRINCSDDPLIPNP